MKAKRLTLSNYRGFPQLDIEFGPRITVLAGVNGSGKSAVLRALASVLSHLLREIAPSKETPEPLTATDVHKSKPALTISATFTGEDHAFHGQINRAVPDSTKAREYAGRRDEARFAIRQTRKGSRQEKQLLEEIRFLSALLEQDEDHFSFQVEQIKRHGEAKGKRNPGRPIAILYSTSRYLGRMPPRLAGVKPYEPANAYTSALSGNEVSLGAFATWFRAATAGGPGPRLVSQRIQKQLGRVVAMILPGFTEPRLIEGPRPNFAVKKNGREFELGQLSDGERGLLALAFDLTRRLAIANPELKDPVAQSVAIVLLDEIELHLHPAWQRKVLRRLTRTFKNCQFIATSHSPQVLGEVTASCIRYLIRENDGTVTCWTPPRAFGMDTNRILEEVMATPSRNEGIKNKSHQLFELIDDEKFVPAKKQLSKLESRLGETDADVVRAKALIRFLKGRQ